MIEMMRLSDQAIKSLEKYGNMEEQKKTENHLFEIHCIRLVDDWILLDFHH